MLPIAEATAITFVWPLFVTALSIIFLGEVVGIRRWSATAAGLVGVLIIVRPGAGAFQPAVLFPVLAAWTWACALIATRKMAGADAATTTVLWTAVTGFLGLTMLVPFVFVPPSMTQVALGVFIGLVNATGQVLVVLAYRRGAASVLAPFSYAQLIGAAAMGWLVFNTIPDVFTWIGGAVVIASGIYTAHRERVRARERAAAARQRRST